jgi:hypothetical protein
MLRRSLLVLTCARAIGVASLRAQDSLGQAAAPDTTCIPQHLIVYRASADAPDSLKVDRPPRAAKAPHFPWPKDSSGRQTPGQVIYRAVIYTLGKAIPCSIQVLTASYPHLAEAGKVAIRSATYHPGLRDGRPVVTEIRQVIRWAFTRPLCQHAYTPGDRTPRGRSVLSRCLASNYRMKLTRLGHRFSRDTDVLSVGCSLARARLGLQLMRGR